MPITVYYAGESPTLHPQLGQLNPGANEIPDEMDDVVEACIMAGLVSLDPVEPSPREGAAPEAPAADETEPA